MAFPFTLGAVETGAAKQKLKANGEQFDAVIVPGLDDMQDARTLFPGAKLLYWIHNISAICKPRYLSLIRYADYFVTPSRSAYHLLLQKMQPAPLLASYYFLPNWCEAAFTWTGRRKWLYSGRYMASEMTLLY